MNKDNNFGRLLLLLLLAFGICLGLYYLPDQLFGMKIKKVDLLSDLRIKPESLSMDSLRMQLEQPDTVRIDSAAVRDSILKTTGIDSVALALRDSLYKVMYADKGADSLGTRIEDYSVGHIGLKRFFAALRNRSAGCGSSSRGSRPGLHSSRTMSRIVGRPMPQASAARAGP